MCYNIQIIDHNNSSQARTCSIVFESHLDKPKKKTTPFQNHEIELLFYFDFVRDFKSSLYWHL